MSEVSGKRVAVFAGGVSGEREVSLRSGASIAASLRRMGAEVFEVDPMESGWTLPENADLAFLALHGEGGEDGAIQNVLEKIGVPYTGSDEASSRLAFDKQAAKTVFLREGVPTPPSIGLNELERSGTAPFGFPRVVKPVCGGSSLHLYFVDDQEAWHQLIPTLPAIDFLVEREIRGREFTVGLLGGQALPIVEIVPKDGRYDYSNKYTKGGARYDCPAHLDPGVAKQMMAIGSQAFEVLGCRDYGRVDVMMDGDGSLFALEVNTLPGMTETSLLPKAAAAAGLSFDQLCSTMAELAWRRTH